MSVSFYRFIDPHILAAISNLPLLAKTVVDGFMLGAHQGPQPGAGQEFNQYRSYQPGDDPRRVDWKMYARSDRFYVRESEIETSITVRFILDASASMLHADGKLVKFDYARFLIAALGYLAHRQGDAIALHGVPGSGPPGQEGEASPLLPRRDHQQLHRFLNYLEKLTASGRWPEWQKMVGNFSTAPGRELIFVVSDLHEHGDEIATALSKLRALKHEVLLFHLLGRNEIDFTYSGEVAFRDLETGQTLPVNTGKARAGYRQALQQYLNALSRKWREQDVAYELLALDRPLDFALRRYLTQRTKLW